MLDNANLYRKIEDGFDFILSHFQEPIFPRKIMTKGLGYQVEIFNSQNIPAELNRICSFNNDGKFGAIFNGVNQYQFKQMPPIVGHSYFRQIVMNLQKECISYLLEDQNTKQTQRFDLPLNTGQEYVLEGKNHFTGVEWWNKTGNFPYPIRYHVEVSQLMYGLSDNPSDSESMIYGPYNTLIPNTEGSNTQYPVSFHNLRIESGCICYGVKSGNCKNGMKYLPLQKTR
jgi:hypothetical protein